MRVACTKQKRNNRKAVTPSLLAVLVFIAGLITTSVEAQADKQLECLERDWFTLLARTNSEITHLDVTTADLTSSPSTELTNVFISVQDYNRDQNQRNSHLAYMNYATCETLFFLRLPEPFQPDMQAIAIGNEGRSYQTLYHAGLILGTDKMVVTKIEEQKIQRYTYYTPTLVSTSAKDADSEQKVKTTLLVLQPGLLLWQHAYGSMLINLNSRIARSIQLYPSSTDQLTSLVTTPTDNSHLNMLTWERRDSQASDRVWLHKFDLVQLGGSSYKMPQVETRSFDLQLKVGDAIAAETEGDVSALCFTDGTQTLSLALWDADRSDVLYHAKVEARAGDYTRFSGCANVKIETSWDKRHMLNALVVTNASVLALLSVEIDSATKYSLQAGSGPMIRSAPYLLTKQKLYMFEQMAAPRFSVTPEFIAVRSPFSVGSISENWGFILNTDYSKLRKTDLWEHSSIIQDAQVTAITGKVESFDKSYSALLYSEDISAKQEFSISSLAEIWTYNAWIGELCGESENSQTLVGGRFEMDYPGTQQITLRYDELVETDSDLNDEWYTTCYPTLDLMVSPTIAPRISVLSVDSGTSSALVEITDIAEANLYIERASLNGYGQGGYQRLAYYLQLPEDENFQQKYKVGFFNDAPRITNGTLVASESSIFDLGQEIYPIVAIDPSILISIQWAPNPPTPGVFLTDIDGENRDLLWESQGPAFDPQGDKITFQQLNLTYFCQAEMTKDMRVRIYMTKQMQLEFTGLHRFSFNLSDNGRPAPATTTYDVTLVIGLYKADPYYLQRKNKNNAEEDDSEVVEDEQEQEIPPAPVVENSEQWFKRRPYDERPAQLRVHPISSFGELRITLTKSVEWPLDILQRIDEQKLMNVTFEPKTYDYDEDKDTTELTSWRILTIQPSWMQLKFEFANPNMIGYSIFESDQVFLEIDFRSIFPDSQQEEELYGKFIKPLPLQYPEQVESGTIVDLNQWMNYLPPLMMMLLCFSGFMLTSLWSIDHASIVWLTLSHLQLVAFLPLMNVPIPAQVNEISKALSMYLRLDLFEVDGKSLTTVVTDYIFDFPPSSEIMPLHHEQLGFESNNAFTSASGLNLLHILIVVPVIVILIGSHLLKLRFKACGHVFYRLRSMFCNAFYIRFGLETYLVYLVANMLTVQDISFYNWASSLQSLVSGIHLVLLAVMPLAVVVFYSMNYDKLVIHKNFRQTWGNLYVGMIGDKDESKRKVTIQFPAAQLARKFVFIFTVTVMRDQWIVQLGAICFATMIVIQITSQPNEMGPYLNRHLNKLQIFLDIMVIFLADFMVAFNGGGYLSKDQNIRFSIGWAYVTFLAISVAPPFIIMTFMTFKVLKQNLQDQLTKSKQQKKREQLNKKFKRRQSLRMNKLQSNARSSMSPQLNDSSRSKDSINFSPQANNEVVLQSAEDKIAVRLDQEKLKRGLTEIVEGCSSEEVTSSSGSFVSSDITETVRSSKEWWGETHQKVDFVMGVGLLPDQQQKEMRKRPRTVPPGGRQALDDIIQKSRFSVCSPTVAANQDRSRSSTSMPPKPLRLNAAERKYQSGNVQHESASSSQTGSESFKASSHVERKGGTQGYLTTKHKQDNSTTQQITFSNQAAMVKHKRHDSISHLDDALTNSQQATERQLLGSQQNTQRSHSNKKNPATTKKLNVGPYTHAQLSMRSTESRLSQIPEAVLQRIEQMAEKKVLKQDKMLETPEKSAPTKGNYVMGRNLAHQSMVIDMAENIMVLSSVQNNVAVEEQQEFLRRTSKHFEQEQATRDRRRSFFSKKQASRTPPITEVAELPEREEASVRVSRPSQDVSTLDKKSPLQSRQKSQFDDGSLERDYESGNDPERRLPNHMPAITVNTSGSRGSRSAKNHKSSQEQQSKTARSKKSIGLSVRALTDALEDQQEKQTSAVYSLDNMLQSAELTDAEKIELGTQRVERSSDQSQEESTLKELVVRENQKYEKHITKKDSRCTINIPRQLLQLQAKTVPVDHTPQFNSATETRFNNSFTHSLKDGLGGQYEAQYEASEANEEVLSLDERRESSQSKQRRPNNMPILNLDADILLSGINHRVAIKMPKMTKTNSASVASEMSDVSKFTIEDDGAPEQHFGSVTERDDLEALQ